MHGRLRARPGAVGARRHPGGLQRQAARARLAALRADHGGRDPARPGDRRRRRQPHDQRAGGVHAGQRVHPRRVRGPRVLRGRRLLRPRDRGRRRHRPADGDVDRRRRARAGPLEDGHPAVRAGSTARRRTRWRARSRTTRPTTTSTTRTRSASRAVRCGRRRPTSALAGLGASFGEKSGWERPNWFESNAVGRRRVAPAARLGRPALVAGDRGRGAGHPAHGRASSTRSSFAKIEVSGPGAVAFLQRLCANDVDRPVGSIVYTQMLDVRGGIEAT